MSTPSATKRHDTVGHGSPGHCSRKRLSITPGSFWKRAFPFLVFAAATFFEGCGHVDATKQRLVSKPNMVFSDAAVFAYQSRFIPILEPGSASDGGSAATGCSSCR